MCWGTPVDIFLPWGGDIQLDQYGGIQNATEWTEVEQEVSRELYTCPVGLDIFGNYLPPDCPFEPGFGLGLSRVKGQLGSSELINNLQTICQQAVNNNPNTSKIVPPIVKLTLSGHELDVIIYITMQNNTPGAIAFSVTP